MMLKTLGGVKLEGSSLTRYKPLLLLSYLALEGVQSREHIAELFWHDKANPRSNLSMALSHIRKAGPDLITASQDSVATSVNCDAVLFLKSLPDYKATDHYQGVFLQGVFLTDWSIELEEWVYEKREQLAFQAQNAIFALAKLSASQGHINAAAKEAERAYMLSHAAPLEPELLPSYYQIFKAANHPYAAKIRQEAQDFDLPLDTKSVAATEPITSQVSQEENTRASFLPSPSTTIVGRDLELIELRQLIEAKQRLINITGLHGSGKTRLALELAWQLRKDKLFDEIYFANLATVSSLKEAHREVLRALNVVPTGIKPLNVQIWEYLKDQPALLILDGIDDLLGEHVAIKDFLKDCPKVTVLVTSQTHWKLPEEQVYALKGLTFPAKLGARLSAHYDAPRFFADRAQRVKPDFVLNEDNVASVIRICQLLDGLPLALELAAIWVKLLPLNTIVSEIEKSLDFLKQNLSGKSQSVRAVFEQVWQRLNAEEKRVLCALSVFAGEFGYEAAQLVADTSLDVLLSLHDKSLLLIADKGRFQLARIVKQFAAEKLAQSDNETQVKQRFIHFYDEHLKSVSEDIVSERAAEGLQEISQDLANIEAVWKTALEQKAWAFIKTHSMTLMVYGDFSGHMSTALDLLSEAIQKLSVEAESEPETQAFLWSGKVRLCYRQALFDEALAVIAEALPQLEEMPLFKGSLLLNNGYIHMVRGDVKEAEASFQKSLQLGEHHDYQEASVFIKTALSELAMLFQEEAANEPFGGAVVTEELKERSDAQINEVFFLGRYAMRSGEFELAKTQLLKARQLRESLNNSSALPYVLDALGLIYSYEKTYQKAKEVLLEGYEESQKQQSEIMVAGLAASLARVLPHTNETAKAQEMLQEALKLSQKLRIKPILLKTLTTRAAQHMLENEPKEAAILFAFILAHPSSLRLEHPYIKAQLELITNQLGETKMQELKEASQRLSLESALKTLELQIY